MYVPSQLIVWKNAAATFQNIRAHTTLFRVDILSGLLCYTAFLFLPLVLYRLLQPVNSTCAGLMVALAVVSVPVSLINMQHAFSVLTLMSQADYLDVFAPEQLQAQVLLQLHVHSNGNEIVSIFWGLWLFPFGYLVFRSGFLPKLLGTLLMFGCLGYVINFTVSFLIPGYRATLLYDVMAIPGGIGEIGTCFWLLIAGVKRKQQPGE